MMDQYKSTDLSDAGVGTLDVPGRKVQPAGSIRGDRRTVLLHGASALAATPATLELPLRPQTHATAVPLGTAFVEVHCGITEGNIWSFKKINEEKNNNLALKN